MDAASKPPRLLFEIAYLSEYAVCVRFGTVIHPAILKRITTFNKLLHSKPFPGLIETVAAYTSLTVFYDPVLVSKTHALPGKDGFDKVSWYLQNLSNEEPEPENEVARIITIPVCYGDQLGPDLVDVAMAKGLTPDQVIQLHSSVVYQVYMIGFVPGFTYLGGMDVSLSMPRKAVPDTAVPAGSVAIGGLQTGIYALESPGGWQIIGRTPLVLFDVRSTQPCLLQAGDQVVFQRISLYEFEQLNRAAHADTN